MGARRVVEPGRGKLFPCSCRSPAKVAGSHAVLLDLAAVSRCPTDSVQRDATATAVQAGARTGPAETMVLKHMPPGGPRLVDKLRSYRSQMAERSSCPVAPGGTGPTPAEPGFQVADPVLELIGCGDAASTFDRGDRCGSEQSLVPAFAGMQEQSRRPRI